MQGKYSNLNALELRELFLNNALDANLMSLEDFEKLFGCEIELDDSRADVLAFCSNGLNQYEKYSRDIQMPPLDELLQEHYCRNRKNRNRVFVKVTRAAAFIVLAFTLTALLAQGVAMALGFDLFGYIFNWLKPDTVEITTMEQRDDDTFDSPFLNSEPADLPDNEIENDIVFLDFERIEEINEDWVNRISPWLIENYDFFNGSFMNFYGDISFDVFFTDENGSFISLTIQNTPMFYAEKDDENFAEEITVNGITFAIFNNMEDFQVIWEHDEFLYNLGAFLPLEVVLEIVRNYY
jgi:hypothetical protein